LLICGTLKNMNMLTKSNPNIRPTYSEDSQGGRKYCWCTYHAKIGQKEFRKTSIFSPKETGKLREPKYYHEKKRALVDEPFFPNFTFKYYQVQAASTSSISRLRGGKYCCENFQKNFRRLFEKIQEEGPCRRGPERRERRDRRRLAIQGRDFWSESRVRIR